MNDMGKNRTPREKALDRVAKLKRGTFWFSLMGFVALIALAAGNVTGVTARAANASSASSTVSSTPNPFFSTTNPNYGGGGGYQTAPQTVPTVPLTQTRVS